jgi:hypothetical protein
MAVQSRSGFKAAVGSFADIVTTAGAMPVTYIALFLIGAVQGFIYSSVDRTGKLTGQYTTQTLIGDAVGFGAALLIIPFGVGLLRYFTRAAPSYPSDLVMICLRVIGWSIVLFVLWLVLAMAIAVPAGILGAFAQDISMPLIVIAFAFVVIVVVVLVWIGLRLALFYPIIARSEPSPILGSFRQTKGFAFYVFRALFFAALVAIPLGVAMLYFQLALFGISFEDFKAGNIMPMFERQPFGRAAILAVFSGIGTIIVMVFYAAIQGRIFRTIRGID